MKISYHWLKEIVTVPVTVQILADDLSMVGLPVEAMEAHDQDFILELEVTANRGDCLSHRGVAREVATIYRTPLKPVDIALNESDPDITNFAAVKIADPDLCYRYCARVVTGVKVGPSPAWLVERLSSLGQRSINNVADITNLVMLELGQPLHAFDLQQLTDHTLVVRRAKAGERLLTLDGVERKLSTDHLVIADAARAVALAGLMGGLESEISLTTRNVLIESAWFLPTSIRQTARTLGMHTEASQRFERGTDIENLVPAMHRCAQLIQHVAGGEIQKGFVDCYPTPRPPSDILLRTAQITRHVGVEMQDREVERILASLQFKKVEVTSAGSVWRTPPWRNDVTREIDLLEEIVRHHGYNKLPSRMPKTSTRGAPLPSAGPLARLSEQLRALGYFETVTYPFLDAQESARFSNLQPVELANPLSDEAGALRTTMLPSMLEMLRYNLHRGERDVRLLEIGKIYFFDPARRPVEQNVLTLGATGEFWPKNLHTERQPYDLFAFKGDVEQVLALFDLPDKEVRRHDNPFLVYEPTEAFTVAASGVIVATFGAVSDLLRERYKIKQKVYLAEVDLQRLLQMGLRQIQVKPLSSYPAVQRDLSFVVPLDVTWKAIHQAVLSAESTHLIRVAPFDRYQHPSLGEGNYSLSLRLTFQSHERTLVEEEVNAQVEKVIAALESQLHARIRKDA